MPGNKKPRKPRKPQHLRVRAERGAIEREARRVVERHLEQVKALPMSDPEALDMELAPFSALEEMRKGRAGPNEWNSMIHAINHAWTLASHGFGPELLPLIDEAEVAMKRMRARYEGGKSMVLDAAGLAAVRCVLHYWGDQLRLCTVGEVYAATLLVERKYWEDQE